MTKKENTEIVGYGIDAKGKVKETNVILKENKAKVEEFLGAQLSLVKADAKGITQSVTATSAITKAITDSLGDVHYGYLPGTDTKMLYQAGTDILVSMFGLVPEYEVVDKTIIANGTINDIIDYTIKANIMYKGMKLKEAMASCNSHEYRKNYQEFIKDEWHIKKNKSVFDTKNTVLAMAQKRAESRAVAKLFNLKSEFTEALGSTVTSKQAMAVFSSLYAHGKLELPKGYAYETDKQKTRSKEYMKKYFLAPILKDLQVSQAMGDWSQDDLVSIKERIKGQDFAALREAGKARK